MSSYIILNNPGDYQFYSDEGFPDTIHNFKLVFVLFIFIFWTFRNSLRYKESSFLREFKDTRNIVCVSLPPKTARSLTRDQLLRFLFRLYKKENQPCGKLQLPATIKKDSLKTTIVFPEIQQDDLLTLLHTKYDHQFTPQQPIESIPDYNNILVSNKSINYECDNDTTTGLENEPSVLITFFVHCASDTGCATIFPFLGVKTASLYQHYDKNYHTKSQGIYVVRGNGLYPSRSKYQHPSFKDIPTAKQRHFQYKQEQLNLLRSWLDHYKQRQLKKDRSSRNKTKQKDPILPSLSPSPHPEDSHGGSGTGTGAGADIDELGSSPGGVELMSVQPSPGDPNADETRVSMITHRCEPQFAQPAQLSLPETPSPSPSPVPHPPDDQQNQTRGPYGLSQELTRKRIENSSNDPRYARSGSSFANMQTKCPVEGIKAMDALPHIVVRNSTTPNGTFASIKIPLSQFDQIVQLKYSGIKSIHQDKKKLYEHCLQNGKEIGSSVTYYNPQTNNDIIPLVFVVSGTIGDAVISEVIHFDFPANYSHNLYPQRHHFAPPILHPHTTTISDVNDKATDMLKRFEERAADAAINDPEQPPPAPLTGDDTLYQIATFQFINLYNKTPPSLRYLPLSTITNLVNPYSFQHVIQSAILGNDLYCSLVTKHINPDAINENSNNSNIANTDTRLPLPYQLLRTGRSVTPLYQDLYDLRRPVLTTIETGLAINAPTYNDYLALFPTFGLAQEGDETDCSICYSSPKRVIVLPCRHIATCVECAAQLTKCCLCRSDIQSTCTFMVVNDGFNETPANGTTGPNPDPTIPSSDPGDGGEFIVVDGIRFTQQQYSMHQWIEQQRARQIPPTDTTTSTTNAIPGDNNSNSINQEHFNAVNGIIGNTNEPSIPDDDVVLVDNGPLIHNTLFNDPADGMHNIAIPTNEHQHGHELNNNISMYATVFEGDDDELGQLYRFQSPNSPQANAHANNSNLEDSSDSASVSQSFIGQ